MNEEQRAVLTAVTRMEESRGGPVDEYTVARAAGVLATDLPGPEYVERPERERIRRLFDELEQEGMLRVERSGYWRPRTTLAGRRFVQHPDGPPTGRTTRTRTVVYPAGSAVAVDSAPVGDDEVREPRARGAQRAWPTWWPVGLRLGRPQVTLPLLAVGLLAALLLGTLLVMGARDAGTPGATPATLAAANTTATAGQAATGTASALAATIPTPAATTPATTSGGPAGATPSPTARPPTPTPAPPVPVVYVANTDNQGAFLFATPAGERRFAVSEGQELEVIGPDAQDSQGRAWKHVAFGNFEGWILAEFTEAPE